jgi:hypothetical protein
MDMAFLRRVERLLAEREPALLDHMMLVAALAAGRASCGQGTPQPSGQSVAEPLEEPLVELLTAGPDWRRALSAQRGCFSRAEAGRRVNAP